VSRIYLVAINCADHDSHDDIPGEETGRKEGEMAGSRELTAVSLGYWRVVVGSFLAGQFFIEWLFLRQRLKKQPPYPLLHSVLFIRLQGKK